MCNLYRMTTATAEVAHWFGADDAAGGANFAAEVYPGYPGVVVADGVLRVMNWGFPLQLKGNDGRALKPKPVNNARSDKLDSPFWRESFMHRRCLIPISAWAEAEGKKGSMTRTWLVLPDDELFACAGLWRCSGEWGDCYTMVLTDAAGAAAEVHTRMPVILARSDYSAWTDGDAATAHSLCQAWSGEIVLDRTAQPWSAMRGSTRAHH